MIKMPDSLQFSSLYQTNRADARKSTTNSFKTDSVHFGKATANFGLTSDNHGQPKPLEWIHDLFKHKRNEFFSKEKGNKNFFLFNGDFFFNLESKGFITYPEKEAGSQQMEAINMLIRTMKMFDPDIQVFYNLGNHDFDAGDKKLFDYLKRVDIDTVFTNCVHNNSPTIQELEENERARIKEMEILEIPDDNDDKIVNKILLLGIAQPCVDNYNKDKVGDPVKDKEKGLDIIDRTAKKDIDLREEDLTNTCIRMKELISEFKKKNPNGVVAVASHNGKDVAKIFADKVPDIDVIFNGHDHLDDIEKYPSRFGKPVHILSLGQNSNKVDLMKMTFNDKGEWTGDCDVKTYKPKDVPNLPGNGGEKCNKFRLKEDTKAICEIKAEEEAEEEKQNPAISAETQPPSEFEQTKKTEYLKFDGIRKFDNNQAKLVNDLIRLKINSIIKETMEGRPNDTNKIVEAKEAYWTKKISEAKTPDDKMKLTADKDAEIAKIRKAEIDAIKKFNKVQIWGCPSSAFREDLPLNEAIDNLTLKNVLSGQTDDISRIYTGPATGRQVIKLVIENFIPHVENMERNTLVQWSGLQIYKSDLIKAMGNETATTLIEAMNLRKIEDDSKSGNKDTVKFLDLHENKEVEIGKEKAAKLINIADNISRYVRIQNNETGEYEPINLDKSYGIAIPNGFFAEKKKMPTARFELQNVFKPVTIQEEEKVNKAMILKKGETLTMNEGFRSGLKLVYEAKELKVPSKNDRRIIVQDYDPKIDGKKK